VSRQKNITNDKPNKINISMKKVISFIIFVNLVFMLNREVKAQTYFTSYNNETNLQSFSTITGHWNARNPINNALGGDAIQGINFGFDANNYISLANSVLSSDLYFGRWCWGWKGWNKIWHSDNLNKIDVDFSAKNNTIYGVLKTINKDNSVATWDNLSLWTDGGSSYIYANNDENGLFIKSVGGNKIIMESNVGFGTSTPSGKIHSNVVGVFDVTPLIRLGNDDNTGRWDVVNAGNPTGRRILQGFNETTKTIQFDPAGNIWFNTGGNVLIGKTIQTGTGVKYKLDVAGSVRANEVVVNTDGADFVFEPTYKLRPLFEVETFIKANKHLPEVAPAAEMQANGVSVAEFQTKLLEKVEELTLYSIEQSKQLQQQQRSNSDLQQQLAIQAKEIEQLKQLINQKLK
jgi:hypothetical protein